MHEDLRGPEVAFGSHTTLDVVGSHITEDGMDFPHHQKMGWIPASSKDGMVLKTERKEHGLKKRGVMRSMVLGLIAVSDVWGTKVDGVGGVGLWDVEVADAGVSGRKGGVWDYRGRPC